MNSTSPAPKPTQPERQRRTKVCEFTIKKTGSIWRRFSCGQLISKNIYNSLVSNGSNPMVCQPSSGSSQGAEVNTISRARLALAKPFFALTRKSPPPPSSAGTMAE